MSEPAPDVARMLERIRAAGRPRLEELSLEEVRASTKPFLTMQGEPEPMHSVRSLEIPGPGGPIAARLYDPVGEIASPAIVWFHGGGWVMGDLEIGDRLCRAIAARVGAVVVSVDYRLAPEHPFPAAYDDAVAAVRWSIDYASGLGIAADRVAVGGDSAGGNLAAAVALAERARLAGVLLAYPVLDSDFDTDSYLAHADNEMMPRSTLEWFWSQYSPDGAARQDERAAPLRAGSLEGLPPVFVGTCELDPLRDEGRRFAARLEEAGVTVVAADYEGLVHGGLWMLGATPSVRPLFDDLSAAARQFFEFS